MEEEDIYSENVQSIDLTQKQKELEEIEREEQRFRQKQVTPSDLLFIFVDTEFLYFSYKKDKWERGDIGN